MIKKFDIPANIIRRTLDFSGPPLPPPPPIDEDLRGAQSLQLQQNVRDISTLAHPAGERLSPNTYKLLYRRPQRKQSKEPEKMDTDSENGTGGDFILPKKTSKMSLFLKQVENKAKLSIKNSYQVLSDSEEELEEEHKRKSSKQNPTKKTSLLKEKPKTTKNPKKSTMPPIVMDGITTNHKTIDKIILTRLHNIEHDKQIIPKEQYGFRARHSTASQVIRVAHHAKVALNSQKQTVLVALDTAKAFDTVWTGGLMNKMVVNDYPVCIVKTVQSYLNNRQFEVKINNVE